jgi:2-polyprenyl-3-methyl-5-hydroxy-6-metoxy-1,4-benzoquinol methylase
MTPDQLQKLCADTTARGGYVGDDESSNRFQKVRVFMREYTQARRILDVGCATGSLLKPYTQVHHITGVDISELLLETARQNGYRQTFPMDISTAPLPFADKSFDLVFCGECIEHVVDTDWVLCEINRVLKVNGHFLLTFPNVRTPISMLMMLLNLPPMFSARYRSLHVRDFTTRTMAIALRNSGFHVDKMLGSDFYLHKLGYQCSRLATFLPSWASTVVARAGKERDAAYSVEAVATGQMQ